MSSAKVVGIHGGSGDKNRGFVKPLPMPLVKLREAIKQRVHMLLRTLFESADDALFAMADKAGTNNEQTLYFDAMRELRLQKKHIATTVVKNLIRSFNDVGNYRTSSLSQESSVTELDKLDLVQNDDLEIHVAVEGMVNRLRSTSGQSLDEFQVRVQSLLSPQTIAADQTPGSPEMLCDSFVEGCAGLDIEIRARLVVLKLFEKFVLVEMASVYSDANQQLVKQGVMPEIKKRSIGRAAQGNRTESTNPSFNNAGNSAGASCAHANTYPGANQNYASSTTGGQFEDLCHLLHQSETNSYMGGEPPVLSDVFYSQGELLGALSMFQSERMEQLGNFGSNQVIDFRSLLSKRLTQGECQADYSEMDADVINLVSMLFEFILDDRQLQPTMKALIARLQIPILKIAIMDRSFFNKGGHPARKLLNEIALAAIGWNEPKDGAKDRLKDRIENVVIQVIEDFDQDMSLFNDLLSDFSNFIDVERRRGQLVEQRTKDSEKGKAVSEMAKLAAQDSLNESMKGQNIPEFIVELLRDGWSPLMVLHYLKDGDQSANWVESCQLVDELIWSINPKVEEADARSKLLKMIPSLMKRFRSGLKEVSFDEFRTQSLLKGLEELHVKALQSLQSANQYDSLEVSEHLTSVADAGNAEIQDEQAIAEQDDVVADLVRSTMALEEDFNAQFGTSSSEKEPAADELSQDQSIDAGKIDTVESGESIEEGVEHEEIVLVSVEQDLDASTIDESDPFVQQVEKFSVGCWFEFESDVKAERCKLAAVIKATGKYIFVNRAGVKVVEKSKMGLAVELRRGSVQILNDGLLFDRALESIITNLRGKGKEA